MHSAGRRRIRHRSLPVLIAVGALLLTIRADAQLSGTLARWREHPAIGYKTQPTTDAVAKLNRELDNGRALSFDGPSGYLRATLDALHVPVESQIAVFAQDSAQAPRIAPTNPRTIFFNDFVAVGWVRGGFMELAAQDPRQGVIFYSLDTLDVSAPRFRRRDDCLSCHHSYSTAGIPGMLVRSAGQFTVDHSLSIDQRWGGWYVTSKTAAHHLGNVPLDRLSIPAPLAPAMPSFADRLDASGYLSTHSDVVALMVFDHQMHGLNLLTRIGWEARVAAYQQRASSARSATDADESLISMTDAAREVVDYLLFIDEVPLTGRLEGTAGFAGHFSEKGPRDRLGRSLRDFDLQKRLMRYPCSYLIYSDVFEALPSPAKDAIYARLIEILTGREDAPRYQRLSAADRQAVLEILLDTKQDFAARFP